MTNFYHPVVAECEVTATMSLDDKGNWVHIAEYKKQQEEIERLREWNRQMVEKAAGGGALDGYRELGARLAEKDAEIERLRKQATQRGARMQVMRDYLTQYSGSSTTLWRDFCRVRPEAAEWFDGNGVPK